MFDLPVAVNSPARGAIIVVAREAMRARGGERLSTPTNNLIPGRLHIASFIPCATLENRRSAIPVPG
ncbi:MAG: hypothetical protein HOM55_01765 [Proteobacteria bacterium]|nr:hypothetical protein [Pseudomonadota bacterium]